MRDRRNILDGGHFHAAVSYGTDSAFTAGTGSFNNDVCFFHTSFQRYFCSVCSCLLRSVRRVLLRATESHFTCGGPGDHLTLLVSESDDDIVECCSNMHITMSINFCYSFFSSSFRCVLFTFCHFFEVVF